MHNTCGAPSDPVLSPPQAIGQGLNPEVKPDPSFAPENPEAVQDLAAWRGFSLRLGQGLCLVIVPLVYLTLSFVPWVSVHLMPQLVSLFQGLSLELPTPTQLLLRISALMRGPVCFAVWCACDLALPALLYLALMGSGYGFPIVGRIWISMDRIWWFYAQQVAGPDWLGLVPGHVGARLSRLERMGEPSLREMQREQQRLWGAVCMVGPGLLPVLGFLVLQGLWLLFAVLEPFYTICGNIGG